MSIAFKLKKKNIIDDFINDDISVCLKVKNLVMDHKVLNNPRCSPAELRGRSDLSVCVCV